MSTFRFALLAASIGAPLWAAAEEVRLRSSDGSVVVSGQLTHFDGDFYRLETIYGPMTLDAARVACHGTSCPDPAEFAPEIRLSGPPALGALLMPALIEGYAARIGHAAERVIADDRHFTYVLTDGTSGHPSIRFRFRLTGSDEAFADLLAGEADIALSAREIRRSEVALAREAGLGTLDAPGRSRVLALDGIVAITGAGNPVRQITLRDLARVFSGEIVSWAALGGPDVPIGLHLAEEETAVTQSFGARILGRYGAAPASEIVRHSSLAGLTDAISQDPAAIGITAFSETGSAQIMSLVGPCGFPSVPGPQTLKTEDYPLTAPLFAYLPAKRLPRPGRDFLEYVQSPQADLVVRRAGFVDQRLETIPLDRQGLRIANAVREAGDGIGLSDLRAMVERLFGAERLTVTFRFEEGSSELDAQSRSNVPLLASLIRRGNFDGSSILFAGFSDGIGNVEQNRRLSQRRAEAVRDAVLGDVSAQGVTVETAGFGEALPMACDAVEWGQRINRRVEVWVR